MKELAQSFNNRELALLIWLTLLIGAISFNSTCKKSLNTIIRDLYKPVFLVPLLLASSYTAGIVSLFSKIGWWSLANLKSTILWLVTFAFVSMFEAGLSENYKVTLRKISLDIFKITSLFVFITELHTFHLLVEVILLPIVTIFALMAELGKNKPEYASVVNLVNAALTLFILGFFMFSLWMTYDNFEETISSVRVSEILTPVALSIFFIPFLFLWCLYVAYNGAFSVITNCLKDKKLIFYAYWLAITQIRDNTDLLQQWKSEIVATHPSTKTMLRNSLTTLRKLNKNELSPPIISPDKGWSPYLAKDFMKAFGLTTGNYKPSFGDEWFASSNPIETGNGLIWKNNYCYYVEGNPNSAFLLKFKLNINDPSEPEFAELEFTRGCMLLLEEALSHNAVMRMNARILTLKPFSTEIPYGSVSLTKEPFSGGIAGGYSLIFRISRGAQGDEVEIK